MLRASAAIPAEYFLFFNNQRTNNSFIRNGSEHQFINLKLKTKNTVAEYCRESQDANYENINQLLQGISYCKFSSITIMDLALKLPSTVLPNRFIRFAIMIHQRHGDNFHPQA
jgi:hypothetical protein